MTVKTRKKADGENILYHFIQKHLLDSDEVSEFQKELIEYFIIDLGIWIPTNLYRINPLLLPFVLRDSSCRKKDPKTGKHEWGISNEKGYLRDDNSLIKDIFNTCPIKSPEIKQYNKHFLGKGFVASHIWREVNNSDKLASTLPFTNSFIPNLVWLPKQISKLTDREGSYAQKLLQSISYNIYREINEDDYTNEIWEYLPNPKIESRFDIEKLNFFDISDVWIEKRLKKLNNEFDSILNVIDKKEPALKKVKCSVYLPTLEKNLNEENREQFKNWIIKSKNRINNVPQHGV